MMTAYIHEEENLPEQPQLIQKLTPMKEDQEKTSRISHFREGMVFKAQRKYKEAIFCFQRGAKEGYNKCIYELGSAYLEGKGVDEDIELGIKYMSEAAENNLPSAQYLMGCLYSVRGKAIEKDEEIADNWLRKAAKNGHQAAQYNLGIRLSDRGKFEEAVKLFKRCNTNAAKTKLGILYLKGKAYLDDNKDAKDMAELKTTSEEKSLQTAFNLLETAATHGNTIAQNKLAWMYFDGRGVEKDPKTAFAWFLKSAGEIENPDIAIGKSKRRHLSAAQVAIRHKSQYQVALGYQEGKVVEKDIDKALLYFNMALKGDRMKEAQQCINKIEASRAQTELKLLKPIQVGERRQSDFKKTQFFAPVPSKVEDGVTNTA